MAAPAGASLLAWAVLTLGGSAAGSKGTECLLWQGEGCQSITAEAECLNRRDGRPWIQQHGLFIAGQPCSWCGGEECANNSDALCLPHDWVKQRANISTANCSMNHTHKANAAEAEAAASPSNRSDTLLFEKPARGARCSAARKNDSEHINKYYFTYTSTTSTECKAICAAQEYCTGFGFEVADHVCKVWWHPIESTEPSSEAGDECSQAIVDNTPKDDVDGQQQVMAQMEDDPRGNETVQELEAQGGLTDQQKGAIAGGVVGGAAAAGLLGGLLGGLLPRGTATVTTTLVDQMVRFMAENETMDDITNDSANDSLAFLGSTEGPKAGGASWIWWLAAAAAALALAATTCYCALSSDSSRSSRGLDNFDSDEESVSATPRLEEARQPPVLLSRAAPRADYKQLAAANAFAEPIATRPQMAPLPYAEPVQSRGAHAGAAGVSARSFVVQGNGSSRLVTGCHIHIEPVGSSH